MLTAILYRMSWITPGHTHFLGFDCTISKFDKITVMDNSEYSMTQELPSIMFLYESFRVKMIEN